MRRIRHAVLATLALVAIVGVWWAPPASAGTCTHVRMDVVATLNRDASMDVVEQDTFECDEGHGGIRQINLSGGSVEDDIGATEYQLSDIEVTESGEPVPIYKEYPGYVQWGEADVTISGTHVYELTYTVTDAVAVAPDVGVLYWQFVGGGSPKLDVDVVIHTPGDGTDLRIWAHGILEGVSRLEGSDAIVTVDNNPAQNAVEVRLAEPSSDYNVGPSGSPLLDEILNAETGYAERSNRLREKFKEEEDRKALRKNIGNVGAPVAALGGLAAFSVVFMRWGKEPPKPTDVGDYWRDIPEDPPAVCQTLLQFGIPDADGFSATLVDLAQRGYLTIAEEGDDFRFTRTAKTDGSLNEFESTLLGRLFPSGGSITQDELVEQAKADRTDSAEWMNSFKGAVGRDFSGRGYVDTEHSVKWALHFLIVVVLAIVGVAALAFDSPLGWLAIAAGVVLLGLSPLLRKRTASGTRRIAEVQGLKRFLKDFSRLGDEAHVGDMVLYERYLVYAVALGVAKELVAGLRVRFPQLAEPNSGFATWYVAGSMLDGGGLSGVGRLESLGSIDSFAREFNSATSAAFSPPSSSSGGGGGFSGGGGGGGGGGGSGGW